jgi:sec-independent protein translocase protein TatB
MFDVGFWELAVIFVMGLLVLGPERLPRVAQQVGQWAGKARRMARVLTTQIQDEMNAVDPRRIMDPPPATRPPPVYSRPGVDDLRPRDVAGEEAAHAAAADTAAAPSSPDPSPARATPGQPDLPGLAAVGEPAGDGRP